MQRPNAKPDYSLLEHLLSFRHLPPSGGESSTGISRMAAVVCFNCAMSAHTGLWPRKQCLDNRVMLGMIVEQLNATRASLGRGRPSRRSGVEPVRCSGIGIGDFIGGDLLKPDLGRWLSDVEEHKALAIYTPHEGGYEGRYLTRLRYQGYYFLDLSARGLGDPETTLTKIHPVCPPHVGKQPIARWYFPPEVDYRLAALPPDAKGLVVWIIEAKVLSKSELQFLALLPTLRPKVRVIAECGNWRKVMWKPLKEIAGLTADTES